MTCMGGRGSSRAAQAILYNRKLLAGLSRYKMKLSGYPSVSFWGQVHSDLSQDEAFPCSHSRCVRRVRFGPRNRRKEHARGKR